ncbi:retrotransposon hot spot (RHS) protein [Trypanosoma cruzi]|uniref:Retrotransposon hot spot (RHS) protein n=1 Tax=Trypanosoma cruzi TaxID=5693 RepID=A0A7J6XUD0_TRYCR|nr:retrotransposon hot spot (RHS) protein [Trypanosoma cruzi]
MDVREGEPPQSWTDRQLAELLKRMTVWSNQSTTSQADGARLDKGWSWSGVVGKYIRDCYVNCEVERVWQTVKGDATEWFSGRPEEHLTPHPRVLIGTLGIGKSMAAGSYLIYQLLHYDVEKLPVVAHFMVSGTYLLDMTARTVSECMGESSIVKVVKGLSRRGVRGCIVYDAAETDNRLSTCLPPLEWGMLVVTPPEAKMHGHWASEGRAARIVMDCSDESDAKAICVWMWRDQPCSSKRNGGAR